MSLMSIVLYTLCRKFSKFVQLILTGFYNGTLLVSTYVVCERLFAMQGLPECGWHGKIFAHFGKNTLFLPGQEIPPSPPEMKMLARSWHFGF